MEMTKGKNKRTTYFLRAPIGRKGT